METRTTTLPQMIAIIGAARSGLAAAKFLLAGDKTVFVSDSSSKENMEFVLASNELAQVEHEAEGHTEAILSYDAIVLSPGVPSDLPILQKARNAGVPVWSEIELAYRASTCNLLAVTGSSGKSTTVSLLASALQHAGITAPAVGNIGIPAISVLPELAQDAWPVVEVSSFQLETVDQFHPRGAAVLNFMKNHLDRYDSEESYYNAKKRIAENLGCDDYLVLNAEDPRLVEWASEVEQQTNIVFVGTQRGEGNRVWYESGALYLQSGGDVSKVLDVTEMKLRGVHNYLNAAVAVALGHFAAKVPAPRLVKGLCEFGGLPHRLEYVDTIDEVLFYNDSKATTAEAMLVAVEAFDKGVHLIAGGRDKGCDFSLLSDQMGTRVTGVYLIGEAAGRIESQWSGKVDIVRCESMGEAVKTAYRNAQPGDAVVLSPGCSSFDMYNDYEERGQVFRECVLECRKQKGAAQ